MCVCVCVCVCVAEQVTLLSCRDMVEGISKGAFLVDAATSQTPGSSWGLMRKECFFS